MSTVIELPQNSSYRAQVAQRLRLAIAARGYRKSDVARGIGMNQASFSRRLNAKITLSLDEVDQLAIATGINRDWLLTGTGPMFDPDWCPQQGSNLRPAD